MALPAEPLMVAIWIGVLFFDLLVTAGFGFLNWLKEDARIAQRDFPARPQEKPTPIPLKRAA
jgi:hypothetical protein